MNPPASFTRLLGPGGLESRALPADSSPVTTADTDGALVIRGYGAVYNVVTTIGGEEYGFDEMFAPAAFRQSVTDGADVRCMFNHRTDNLLGRTKSKTLRLADEDAGCAYEVDVNPDDPEALSVHAKVKRGDVDGSSVWFRCIEDMWTYPDATNGLVRPLRVIVSAALIEIGPVTFPAYEDAESSARSISAPFDALLDAANIKSPQKRAALAADFLADPAAAAAELRHILASVPKSGPAAVPAPAEERAVEPTPEPDANEATRIAVERARADLRGRLTPA